MKTFKEAVDELNEEYFEDFDLWRCGDMAYTDEKMLAILKEYRTRYQALAKQDLPR